MKITLITPHIGRKDVGDIAHYVKTWQMEPLPMAVLAGLTPPEVELSLFDERVEFIDFDQPTDLVAISVETYTAKRAYEISAEFRRRGVPVIFGGYHASLVSDEASHFADSILIGYAEDIWPQIIEDVRNKRLQKRYQRDQSLPMRFAMPRRAIFQGKQYLDLACVETGRGCPLHCDFCSIMSMTNSRYFPRPIAEIITDIRNSGKRNIFLIDDNIIGNVAWAKQLFRALRPLRITWFSQGTLAVAKDEELLRLMAESGCIGLLIGFESLSTETLSLMKKGVNLSLIDQAGELVRRIHKHGICIYGAFVFGYDSETLVDFRRTVETARQWGLFMSAFNHLMPFPGTPFYEQMLKEGRVEEQWWLSPSFSFGKIPFVPKHFSAKDLHQACLEARLYFYSWRSILYRAFNFRGNLNTLKKLFAYFGINVMLRREISDKDGLPLGNLPFKPKEID